MRGAANKEAVDTASRLKEMNAKALEVLTEILEDADKPIALRAKVAMDNLSRTGFAPQINVKGTFEHRHFGPEEIEKIKLFAIEAAKRQGCLVLEDQSPGARFTAGQVNSEIDPIIDVEVTEVANSVNPINIAEEGDSCG
jgi:hypothetical protein